MTYGDHPDMIATDKFKMYHVQLTAFRKEYKTLESAFTAR